MKKQYIALDMFSGGGGLTEGFVRQGFDFGAHIEMNRYAAETLETRLCYHDLKRSKNQDLSTEYYKGTISRKEFFTRAKEIGAGADPVINNEINAECESKMIESIKRYLIDHYGRTTVDVMIGGPPCQAYSLVGRGRDKNGMKDDPRNYLYRHYITFLDEFKPEIFVFENVPGLKTAKNGTIFSDIQEEIKEIGYSIKAKILNAADFGVLQNRKRIIFIGWKEEHDLDYPEFRKIECNHMVWDILNDLPPLEPGEGMQGAGLNYICPPLDYLSKSGIRDEKVNLVHHIARPHIERDREIYRRAIVLWSKERRRLKYTELPDELKTHNNQNSFLDRFKVVNGDGLSHALVAHIAKDGHYFIHPDLSQARSITVREAARIQSFPDNYYFEGPRTAQFTQIGNAVPPLMAEQIAEGISGMLKKIT